MVDVRNYKSEIPEYVKTLYEQTLYIHGGRLFNLLPEDIRGYNGSPDGFKCLLDKIWGGYLLETVSKTSEKRILGLHVD